MKRLGEASELIIKAVKDMEPRVRDGCLNYVFTQILRKTFDLIDAGIVIDLVINELFWTELSYLNFQTVEGLLNRILKEYKRRGWKRQRKVVKVLKRLIERNDFGCEHYEIEKIKLNGDLR